MRTRILSALGAASLLSVLALTGCTASPTEADDADAPLAFAMPPGTDDPDILSQMDDVAALLAEATGREVETANPADYMAVVEAVRGGFVDIALMSQFSTALAFANGSVVPLVTWKGEEEPASLCLVQADSAIQTLDDFAGHTIAFVDPGSTTGHFMPKSLLKKNGLTDGQDYSSVFAGGHDSAVLAMKEGSVDMACTARAVLPFLVEGGLIAEDEYRVIAETDPIPVGISIVANEDLDETTRAAVIENLPGLLMGQEAIASMFSGSTEYFVEPDSSVFQPLIEVAEAAGVSLEDMR